MSPHRFGHRGTGTKTARAPVAYRAFRLQLDALSPLDDELEGLVHRRAFEAVVSRE